MVPYPKNLHETLASCLSTSPPPSLGVVPAFEVVALFSKSRIEESLERLAPDCTLELLDMPRTPENAERRLRAIAALRELLRQGLDVEASCQINKARTICECLIASEGMDLKLAFCLFVLGQADEAEAVEKLQQLALNTDPASGNSISGKDAKGFPSAKLSLVTSAEKEAQNSSSVRTSGKPYQAPYARLSSLEDPCTANPENGKTPSTGLETETMGVKAQVSGFEDLKLAMIPESLAKVQVKESPKGLKRLLMFAKKNHSSVACEHSVESNNASVDGSELDGNVTNAASSSEASHNFALLSTFRSKTSEKKLTSS
ncbi:hypothetical protein RHSIM_Rhsim07G0183600 [Rhododendron simsii]|uniref:Plastid division protein CDP1-like 1st alpha solenoid domain-containing protein n=1 Tax=Rhododendron simsii TaxID=118357 RepID=A0A834LHB4_RHOSS|nr:hypothetical protein RHSIM_Rhsim07G0183600 [Rhododendron simsii]